jgi:hypothetical protein
MSNVPVSNQEILPACYAFTAASMATAYAHAVLNTSTDVSGAELFQKVQTSDKWVLDANTGRTCNALALAAKEIPGLGQCQKFDFANNGRTLNTPADFLAKIDEQLVLKKLPIGIEYCSGVLLEGHKTFISKRTFRDDLNYLNTKEASENFDDSCNFHASTVIGRERRDDGRCYYYIQNSWGDDCSIYPSSIRPCKGGRIWVPAEDLAPNLFRLSFF